MSKNNVIIYINNNNKNNYILFIFKSMQTKACKIAENSHNYCMTSTQNIKKKNYIVNNTGQAR